MYARPKLMALRASFVVVGAGRACVRPCLVGAPLGSREMLMALGVEPEKSIERLRRAQGDLFVGRRQGPELRPSGPHGLGEPVDDGDERPTVGLGRRPEDERS